MQALPVTSPSNPVPRRDEGPDLQDGRFGAVMASFLPFQAAPAPEAPVAREAPKAPDSVDSSPRSEPVGRAEQGQLAAKAPDKAPDRAEAKAPEKPVGTPATPPEPMAPPQGPERSASAEKPQGTGAFPEAKPGPAPFGPSPLPMPTQAAAPEPLPPIPTPVQASAPGLPAMDLPHKVAPALEVSPLGPPAAPRIPAALSGAAMPPPPLEIPPPEGTAAEPIQPQIMAPAPEAEGATGPSLPPATPASAPLPESPLAPAPALQSPMTPPQAPQPAEGPAPKTPPSPKGASGLAASSPAQPLPVPEGGPSAGSDAALTGDDGNPQTPSEAGGSRLRPVPEKAPTAEVPRAGEPQKPFAPEPIPHRVEAVRPEPPKVEAPKLQIQPGFARDGALALPTVAPAAGVNAEMKLSPSPVVNQVEGTLRWMIKGAVPEARLQLHPESLGKVSIELKIEGGQVHAKVWVQDPAAMQALQDGRTALEQALKQSGLQLGSFDLQQGSDASRQAPEPNPHHPMGPKKDPTLRAARQEAPVMGGPRPANSRRIELYA